RSKFVAQTFLSPNGLEIWLNEINGETPSMARGTHAVLKFNCIVPAWGLDTIDACQSLVLFGKSLNQWEACRLISAFGRWRNFAKRRIQHDEAEMVSGHPY